MSYPLPTFKRRWHLYTTEKMVISRLFSSFLEIFRLPRVSIPESDLLTVRDRDVRANFVPIAELSLIRHPSARRRVDLRPWTARCQSFRREWLFYSVSSPPRPRTLRKQREIERHFLKPRVLQNVWGRFEDNSYYCVGVGGQHFRHLLGRCGKFLTKIDYIFAFFVKRMDDTSGLGNFVNESNGFQKERMKNPFRWRITWPPFLFRIKSLFPPKQNRRVSAFLESVL